MNLGWYEQSLADVSADDTWLSAWEKSHLAGLRIPKRHSDWRLGRWTGKRAVAHYLGILSDPELLATIEIRPETSGAPAVFIDGVPAGVSISLSHREGVAACAIGPPEAIFGCDLEAIEVRSDAFVADYFTLPEQASVKRTPEVNRAVLVALIWSAKESALKALRIGLRADTHCVAVEFPRPLLDEHLVHASSAESGDATISPSLSPVWHPLLVRHSTGSVFQGWWSRDLKLVRTVVSVG